MIDCELLLIEVSIKLIELNNMVDENWMDILFDFLLHSKTPMPSVTY